MDRQTYFKKLSRLVAWRPPRTEAEEVLCDDRKIIFQRPAAQDPGIMEELGTGSAVIGLLGLVKARVDDRRWRALYTLALTVSVECVLVTAILHSLNAELSAGWWRTCAIHLCIIGAAGLICTGGCLCPPARAVQGGLHRVVCRKHISRTHQKILSHHRRRKKKAGRAALLLASPVRDHDVPWHPMTAKTGRPDAGPSSGGSGCFFRMWQIHTAAERSAGSAAWGIPSPVQRQVPSCCGLYNVIYYEASDSFFILFCREAAISQLRMPRAVLFFSYNRGIHV